MSAADYIYLLVIVFAMGVLVTDYILRPDHWGRE